MTAPETVAGYRLIEKPARISSVDVNDVEICGARQPWGHDYWEIHVTLRVAKKLHRVIAMNRSDAIAHVELISELFTRA